MAVECLTEFKIGSELVEQIVNADQSEEPGIFRQRERIAAVKEILEKIDNEDARNLEMVVDTLVKKSVWIIGGDGWAYDIGYGGLDHVLASGQMSKATPIGAVAKFAAGGKPSRKKDLGLIAMAYEDVYVAQVAYGAKDVRTLKAFLEAESYDGVSIIIAYSPCIAHGIDLANNHKQQELAVNTGHFPLFRYDPRLRAEGKNPLQLDSKAPSVPFKEQIKSETRFSLLQRTHPEAAEHFAELAQEAANRRYEHLAQLASISYENKES